MKREAHIFVDNITRPAGTERAVVNLANNLASHGHQTTIYSLYSAAGGPVYPLSPSVRLVHMDVKFTGLAARLPQVGFLYLLRVLAAQTRGLRGALIGSSGILNILLSIVGRRGQQLTVACEHFNFGSATRFVHVMRDKFVRRADHLVVLTKDDAQRYLARGFRNVTVIPNEAPFFPLKEPRYEEKWLLNVGRLAVEKDHFTLLRMVAPLLKERPGWQLHIYGEGELEAALKEEIKSLGLYDRVIIYPPTTSIEDVYLGASLFLLSSKYEGFGMALLEAKACGLPTVAFDCPSGPGTIVAHGEDGFLIPLGEEEEFQRRTLQLMDDEALRRQLGQRGRANARAFDSEHIYHLWQQVLS